MDILHYFALDQLYRERRRLRQKVYVVADFGGVRREGKIIKERDGRWLIEFFPLETDAGVIQRTARRYLSLREFEVHPVDQQQFDEYIQTLYDIYSGNEL